MSRKYSWCFTLNNYTEAEVEELKEVEPKYLVFGKEVGEKGTPHLQCFILFENAKSFNAVKKLLPERIAKLEPRYDASSDWRAMCYCKKGKQTKKEWEELYEDGPNWGKDADYWEIGTKPRKPCQGKRNDLKLIRDQIKEGANMRQIIETATSYQQLKMAELLIKYKPIKEREPPKVRWFWGPSGSGKTRTAYEMFGYDDTYSMTLDKWWDGYDGQKKVIIDDIRRDTLTWKSFLNLFDRYPVRCESKGTSRQMDADEIIITCPMRPTELYADMEGKEDFKQITRRFTEIREFKDPERFCVFFR